jgi:PAS domain S-box-containing protein
MGKSIQELEAQIKELEAQDKAYNFLMSDLNQIMDSIKFSVWILNTDYEVTYVNKQFCIMTGLDFDDIIGCKCYDILPGDSCHSSSCSMKRLENMSGLEMEVERTINDKNFCLLSTIVPYKDETGKIIGVIESFKDITERKKMQALAQEAALQQGKLQISNNILHDIGNATTGISTHLTKLLVSGKDRHEKKSLERLQKLIDNEKNENGLCFTKEKTEALSNFIAGLIKSLDEKHSYIHDTMQNINQSLDHVNKILNIQRLYGSDIRSREYKPFNLAALVKDAVTMMKAGFEKRKISIDYDFPGKDILIAGDHTRIMQVILNALKNTCEAFDGLEEMSDKKVQIKISEMPNNWLALNLTDNACGFIPDKAESFFERGISTKNRASGLGLHECRSIIESHGGNIHIFSEGEGRGTSLVIKLPIKRK